ncbi:unnamed protein product [Withania somnifera]
MDYSGNCQNFVSGDYLFVDDLLDLSNDFPHEDDNKFSPQKQPEETVTNKSPVKEDFGSLLGSELSLPGPDLDNLEWLSHFVEDSFSEYPLTYPSGNLPLKSQPGPKKSCFTGPIQTKAGAQRTRVWPLGPPSKVLSSSSSSTTAISSTSVENKPAARKPKKKVEKRAGLGAKQCSHCGVQKTPLWRTGPLGAKTLCNACGVRFKSGRLLPEYRPASSPTFSTGLHSNSHRKILEMRQKKEINPLRVFEGLI